MLTDALKFKYIFTVLQLQLEPWNFDTFCHLALVWSLGETHSQDCDEERGQVPGRSFP